MLEQEAVLPLVRIHRPHPELLDLILSLVFEGLRMTLALLVPLRFTAFKVLYRGLEKVFVTWIRGVLEDELCSQPPVHVDPLLLILVPGQAIARAEGQVPEPEVLGGDPLDRLVVVVEVANLLLSPWPAEQIPEATGIHGLLAEALPVELLCRPGARFPAG